MNCFSRNLLPCVLILDLFTNDFASAAEANRFGSMTCQQLWYMEQEVLAKGRVCLKSNRATRAFQREKKCISDDERILPPEKKERLHMIRTTAENKKCRMRCSFRNQS